MEEKTVPSDLWGITGDFEEKRVFELGLEVR